MLVPARSWLGVFCDLQGLAASSYQPVAAGGLVGGGGGGTVPAIAQSLIQESLHHHWCARAPSPPVGHSLKDKARGEGVVAPPREKSQGGALHSTPQLSSVPQNSIVGTVHQAPTSLTTTTRVPQAVLLETLLLLYCNCPRHCSDIAEAYYLVSQF